MQRQTNINAALKTFDTIEVAVYKKYTQAEIKSFNIYEDEKFVSTLKWISKSESKSSFIYTINVKYDFKPGHLYELADDKNEFFPLDITVLSKGSDFEVRYRFDGEMGAIYTPSKTTFRLFSPLAAEAYVKLVDHDGKSNLYPMSFLNGSGVYETVIEGDFDAYKYRYVVNLNGELVEATDPYAFALTSNSRYGYVVNPQRVSEIDLKNECLPSFEGITHSTIYELDVRDMTALTNLANKGTYNALATPNLRTDKGAPIGIDYIASLGVSHVQFMPLYDFQTIDEDHPESQYNWGYDPKFFFAPEGSYSSDPNDCYTRVFELRKMVASFHERGMRCVMDVVFNHTFNCISNSLELLCPGYYFRSNSDGSISNGSGCGNDFESRHYMARKLIIDALVHFMNWYGFDGFRFDLMGIIDKDTINRAYYVLKNINKDVILYGEGWDMATALPSSLKASSLNAYELPTIGFFNDRFRDIAKGSSSDTNLANCGYLLGDTNYIDGFKHVFLGSAITLAYPPMFLSPSQSINYVECHDNATVYDKMLISNKEESKEVKLKRIKLINASIILAFGVPFIHAGQEFGATKKSIYNSYNAGDTINGFDYNLMQERKDMVKYLSDAIKLRKSLKILCSDNKEEIIETVNFENLAHGAVLIKLDDKKENRFIHIIINPSSEKVSYHFDNYARIIFNEAGIINTDFFSQLLIVNGLTLTVAITNY